MRLKLKAVIFDMDGVVTDTMPYHFKVWKHLFKREGIHVTREDVYTIEGQKGIESLKEIFLENQKKFNEGQARALLKEKEDLFKKVFKRRFIVGSRSFLKSLKRKDFKLALVTGTSRHEVLHLLPEPIFKLFDVTVCGCEVQNGKPHPEPYLTALRKLEITAADAVVIENAPFGIRSAQAAGFKCIAIETSLPKKYLKQADKIVHSFKDLTRQIEFVFNE